MGLGSVNDIVLFQVENRMLYNGDFKFDNYVPYLLYNILAFIYYIIWRYSGITAFQFVLDQYFTFASVV
jgi:hypothetical protein